MANEKLLSCPFCGGKVFLAAINTPNDDGEWYWFITRGSGEDRCKCRVFMESEKFRRNETDGKEERDALVKAWNRRCG